MTEQIRKNIETEMEILREIYSLFGKLETARPEEKRLITMAINSLSLNMKTINNSIPDLLNSIGVEKKAVQKTPELEKIEIIRAEGRQKTEIAIKSKDREKFLGELNISESLLKKIRKKKEEVRNEEKFVEFKQSRGYLKMSNRFFLDSANTLIEKGYLKPLASELKKANIDILFESYVAMMLFSALLAFFGAIILVAFLMFFNIGLGGISAYEGDFLVRLLTVFWLPIAIPIGLFLILYYYPSAEKKSIAGKVDEELPFAVIHMSSISGAGLEPTAIFKIIGMSKEYPALKKEIGKVLNQINIYGYDLVTALNNVSKNTASQKLGELFAGLSTTISTGGSLSEFFQKRAETLLINYRLEKEKFIKIAETFMDIYISVVLAAPMILMLLLIMISVSGFQTQFTPTQLSFIIIIAVALINIIFLAFLQTKQTTY